MGKNKKLFYVILAANILTVMGTVLFALNKSTIANLENQSVAAVPEPTIKDRTDKDYYNSGGRRIYLNRADNWIVIQIAKEEQTKNKFEEFLRIYPSITLKQTLNAERGLFWLEISPDIDKERVLQELKKYVNVIRLIPAYFRLSHNGEKVRFIMSDEFHVGFYPHVTRAEIETMNKRYGVEIISASKYDEYLLRAIESSPYTALELANIYYESDMTKWSLPNFLSDIKLEINE